jgi:hypothetical protein
MFSRVAAQEQTVTGGDFKIFSIAPDTVDTDMQAQTRKPDKSEFSWIDTFIGYKENGKLADPKWTARKYIEIIEHPNEIHEVVFSISEYEKMKQENKL